MASSVNDVCLIAMHEEDEADHKLHIAMFPWLAFGHIIPYLELAKLFAQKGHKISFISTPRNILRLPKIPPNLSPLINLVKIPLPNLHGLPNDAEATTDLPLEKIPLLKKVYDLLQQPIADFLATSRPDWLLYDFACFWLPGVSKRAGVRNAFFSIFIASCLAFADTEFPGYRTSPEDFTEPPRWVPFPSTIALRRFEILRLMNEIVGDDDTVSVAYRFAEVLKGCDVVAVRSCRKLENDWLDLLEDRLHKPVFPIGQLAPSPSTNDDETNAWGSIKTWFDGQGNNSVVYVAFGSEAQLGQDNLTELALGLELSEMPFFWVIRPRTGSAGCDPVELPIGFEERVRGRGFVCRSWAPQVKILAHGSVGVFLSHSGWSSVVEALRFAKPLVLLPLGNDQGLNARFLGEKMIGYSVPRDDADGSFRRESVAESLRMVAEREEGKVYREKAMETSELFGDMELQDKYVDEFLGYLKTHK